MEEKGRKMPDPMDRGEPDAPKAMIPRKGRTNGIKDTSTESDQTARFCNRVGCNGRIKYIATNARIGRSSNGDELRRVPPPEGRFRDSKSETSSRSKLNPSGSGSSDESEVSSPRKNLTTHRSTPENEPRRAFRGEFAPKDRHSRSNSSAPKSTERSSSSSSSSPPTKDVKKDKKHGHASTRKNGHVCPSAIGISIDKNSNNIINSSSSSNSNSCCSSSSTKNAVKNEKLEPGSTRKNGRLCPSAGDSKSASSRPANANAAARPSRQHRRAHNSSLTIGGARSSDSRPSRGSSSHGSTRSATGQLDPTHSTDRGEIDSEWLDEVLTALQTMENGHELLLEQMLAIESYYQITGVNLSDQHEGMRLDIDNMSYEELLALEERMGTVSTALSEEALSDCIEPSIHDVGPPEVGLVESVGDGKDLRCSICQEEYMVGDELGILVGCLHKYHRTCISQWLRLKNWCPFCKASVAPRARLVGKTVSNSCKNP